MAIEPLSHGVESRAMGKVHAVAGYPHSLFLTAMSRRWVGPTEADLVVNCDRSNSAPRRDRGSVRWPRLREHVDLPASRRERVRDALARA